MKAAQRKRVKAKQRAHQKARTRANRIETIRAALCVFTEASAAEWTFVKRPQIDESPGLQVGDTWVSGGNRCVCMADGTIKRTPSF